MKPVGAIEKYSFVEFQSNIEVFDTRGIQRGAERARIDAGISDFCDKVANIELIGSWFCITTVSDDKTRTREYYVPVTNVRSARKMATT